MQNGFFEYIYCTDGWSNSESSGLITSMQNGGTCAPNTDYSTYANRLINISSDTIISNVWGSCGTCISGCTDPSASNYNPDAVIDDSTCMLAINEGMIPEIFSLNTYPNPFNPVATVSFAIPEMGLASVKVFDIRGRELAVLSNQNYQPGYFSANWIASAYSSGVYFISLKTNSITITQKVLLLK